ncbi:MAG: MFS transporter [Candidatus Aminicenantes bacterium]|nr:MFS transporter [Candidatus Aminicenantes bacterium]
MNRPFALVRHIDLGRIFTALRHRNYRLWFIGQTISLFGTWMQLTALGYLVFDLTRSPVYLGYVGFATGLPAWLFMAYAGVVADRMPRRKLIIMTQTAMMILAFGLAALTFLGLIRAWEIVLFAFALGVANAFDAPARQAFIKELVDTEDLTNAIALNSTMFNLGIALGPAVSGVTYALFGPGWCFAINGLSFIAIIVALRLMDLPPAAPAPIDGDRWRDLKEGFRYVVGHPVIRPIILLIAAGGLFGNAFLTLIPAWTVKILHGNAATNGWLHSARGVGALAGALLIASLGRFRFKGKLMTAGTFALPVFLFAFAAARRLPLSLLIMAGAGGATVLVMNLCNALVQTHVEERLRGRVMGIYTFAFFGLLPVGALWSGALAQGLGEPVAIVAGALTALAAAAAAWVFAPHLRRLP